jgi:hypothetical protein
MVPLPVMLAGLRAASRVTSLVTAGLAGTHVSQVATAALTALLWLGVPGHSWNEPLQGKHRG